MIGNRGVLILHLACGVMATIGCLVSIGCGQQGGSIPNARPDRKNLGAFPPPKLQSVTQDEAQRLAEEFVSAVNARDYDQANALFDIEVLVDRVCYGVDPKSTARREFVTGFRRGAGQLAQRLTASIGPNVRVGLVRVHKVKAARRALIRLYRHDTGFMYLDLILSRSPDGAPAIVDVYSVGTGEFVSQTVRRMFLAAVAHENRSLLDRVSNRDNAIIKNLSEIQKFTQAQMAGDFERVLEIYESFPAEVQKIKPYISVALSAAANLEDVQRHDDLMRRVKAWYPGDDMLSFVMIDYHALHNDAARMLEAVDNLDKAIGGDPFLDLLRAQERLSADKWLEARKLAQAVAGAVPDAEYAYWIDFEAAVRLRDYRAAVELLKTLHDRFSCDVRQLIKAPEYKAFTGSPEYRALVASLPPRGE